MFRRVCSTFALRGTNITSARCFATWPAWAQTLAVVSGLPAALVTFKAAVTVLAQNKLIYTGYFPIGSRRDIQLPQGKLADHFKEKTLCAMDSVRLHTWIFTCWRQDSQRVPTLLYFHGYVSPLAK